MNKQELILKIEDERAQLEAVIGRLSPEQMLAPNAVGEWSVKDVLAHLTACTARSVTLIYQAEQGQAYEDVFGDVEAQNAEDYEAQKDRPLDRVLADFRGSHRQLLKRLSAWKDADLFDKQRFSWLRGASLGEFILSETAEHEAEHRAQISK
jgi:uncharacterized protein (TIGR03083 family)